MVCLPSSMQEFYADSDYIHVAFKSEAYIAIVWNERIEFYGLSIIVKKNLNKKKELYLYGLWGGFKVLNIYREESTPPQTICMKGFQHLTQFALV